MKRKVIQIANSTQLVSLPRKWALKQGIKKGDEIEVTEEGNRIILSIDHNFADNNITINISDLDTSTVLHYIEGIYKSGYDEIEILYDKETLHDFKSNESVELVPFVYSIMDRLIGMELIEQKKGRIVLKDVSATSFKEFDNVLRRVFLLILDTCHEVREAIQEDDKKALLDIKTKHDRITKFVAFCLRLLNKGGYNDFRRTAYVHHIVASLDKLTDHFKYAAQEGYGRKLKIREETMSMFEKVEISLRLYYNLYYKFEKETLITLSKNRREIQKMVSDNTKIKFPSSDVLLMGRLLTITDMLVDLTEARIALES